MFFVYFILLLLLPSLRLYAKYDEAMVAPASHVSYPGSVDEERGRLQHGSVLHTDVREIPLSPTEISPERPIERYKEHAHGVKYASIEQEVTAAGSVMPDDRSGKKKLSDKHASALLYSRATAGENAAAVMVEDSVNTRSVQENPVDYFFRKGLWVDSIFRKSLLREYPEFFEHEAQDKTFREKVITIQSSKFKKALIYFKEVYGGNFEEEFTPYVTMINEIVTHMNPSLSTRLKRGRIKPTGLSICLVAGKEPLYRLTYEGYQGADIFVTEKSMYLLFGPERVEQLKKDEKAALFIPYKNGLDMLVEGTRVFSVSLLREKSRCVK